MHILFALPDLFCIAYILADGVTEAVNRCDYETLNIGGSVAWDFVYFVTTYPGVLREHLK